MSDHIIEESEHVSKESEHVSKESEQFLGIPLTKVVPHTKIEDMFKIISSLIEKKQLKYFKGSFTICEFLKISLESVDDHDVTSFISELLGSLKEATTFKIAFKGEKGSLFTLKFGK